MYQPISTLNLPKFIIQEAKIYSDYCHEQVSGDITHEFTEDIKKLSIAPPTKTALDLYVEETLNGQIPTFFKELDDSLGGGIPIGLITEFSGPPGSGKSQICYQLCVYAQIPIWCGGVEGTAIYINTNKSLASQRIKEIAKNAVAKYSQLKTVNDPKNIDNFTEVTILDNIQCVEANNIAELIAISKYIEHFLTKQNVKVVIIDTISAPFKQADMEDRKLLFNVLENLQILATHYKFAIVLTNDMTTRVNSDGAYITPSLGETYYHRINARIELSKLGRARYRGKIVKSVCYSQKDFEFAIH